MTLRQTPQQQAEQRANQEKTEAQKKQEERRQAEIKANKEFYATLHATMANKASTFSFKKVVDGEDQKDTSPIALVGDRVKLMEPGIYKIDDPKSPIKDYQFKLTEEGKVSIVRPSDAKRINANFHAAFAAQFDLLKKNGSSKVTIDWTEGEVDKDRLRTLVSMALERNLEIEYGPNVQRYLNDTRSGFFSKETLLNDVPMSPFTAPDLAEGVKKRILHDNKPTAEEADEFQRMVAVSKKRKDHYEKMAGGNRDPLFRLATDRLNEAPKLDSQFTVAPGAASREDDLKASYQHSLAKPGKAPGERQAAIKNELESVKTRLDNVINANNQYAMAVSNTADRLNSLQTARGADAPGFGNVRVGRGTVGQRFDYSDDGFRSQHEIRHAFNTIKDNWVNHHGDNTAVASMLKATDKELDDLKMRLDGLVEVLRARQDELNAKGSPADQAELQTLAQQIAEVEKRQQDLVDVENKLQASRHGAQQIPTQMTAVDQQIQQEEEQQKSFFQRNFGN